MKPKQLVPELVVQDVENSIRFYSDGLGFQVLAKAPEVGSPTWAELVNNSIHLMLQARKDAVAEIPEISSRTIGGTILLVFRTDSKDTVENTWNSYSGKGNVVLPLRKTEYGTVEFAITDPDGYILLFAGSD